MLMKNDIPLVSIVAVCYNHENYLVETLDSILNQSYPNIELIIIDDCSKDNSVKKIEDWLQTNNTDCKFIARKENIGLCQNLNDAIKISTGVYYQSIACDDVILHNKIEEQVNFLEKEGEDVMLVCSNFSTIDDQSKIIKAANFNEEFIFPKDVFSSLLEKYMGYNIIIHSPTVLMRKSIFDIVGLYKEDLKQEDFYMWLLISSKYQIKFIDQVLVQYRELDTSLSKEFKFGNASYYERTKVISLFYNLKGKQLKSISEFQVKQIKRILQHGIKTNDEESLNIGLRLYGELHHFYSSLEIDKLLYEVYQFSPRLFNDWAKKVKFKFEKSKYQLLYKTMELSIFKRTNSDTK